MATKKENERMAVVETKLDTVIERLDDMQKAFAAKWVEKVVAGLIGAILLAFIGALITLAFKEPEVATIPTTKTVTVTVNTNGTTTTKTTENGHTTTSTRPSSANEKPGTTTVITEEKATPAQKNDNGNSGNEDKEDPKQSTVPILGPLVDNLKNRLGRN